MERFICHQVRKRFGEGELDPHLQVRFQKMLYLATARILATNREVYESLSLEFESSPQGPISRDALHFLASEDPTEGGSVDDEIDRAFRDFNFKTSTLVKLTCGEVWLNKDRHYHILADGRCMTGSPYFYSEIVQDIKNIYDSIPVYDPRGFDFDGCVDNATYLSQRYPTTTVDSKLFVEEFFDVYY